MSELDKQLKVLALRIMDSLFPQQRAFVTSRSRRMAVCCTRRAAKTTSVAARHLVRCLTKPDARCLYLSMYSANVHRDYWINSVQRLLHDAGYRGRLPVRLPFVLPNGSRLEGAGLDNAQDAYKKIRGSQWDEVDIDEVQSWDSDVEDMIASVLQPTVRERRGTIAVTGTPGDVHGGFWHRLALGDIPGWQTMGWSWRDNLYTRAAIDEELRKELEEDPGKADTPAWRRENEGQWVIEDDLRVYHYGKHNLLLDCLPGPDDDFLWGLGVDTGFRNASAIVELAYPRRVGLRKAYVTWAWKMAGIDIIALGQFIKERYDTRPYSFKVADPANAQGVETINMRFGMNLTSADKLGKKEHIEVFNADLRRGDIQVLPPARDALLPEWDKLVWDRKELAKGRYEERAGLANHCADSALYGHQECRHFWAKGEEGKAPHPLILTAPPMAADDEADYLRQLDDRDRRQRSLEFGFSRSTRLL